MKDFLVNCVLIGAWLLSNWFKIVLIFLFIILIAKVDWLVEDTMTHDAVLNPQYANFRDINESLSAIKKNTSDIVGLLQDMDYHTQYPSIIR